MGVTENSGGLHDCTVPQTSEDVPMLRPNIQSMAQTLYGRAYSDLTRREQRRLDRIVKGHKDELEAQIRSLAKNNLLDVQERIQRIHESQEVMADLLARAAQDTMDFYYGGDNAQVSEHADYMKNASGTQKRKVLNLKTLVATNEAYVRTQAVLAKLQQEREAATFIREGDRKTVIVTPEDVTARLSNLGRGQIVDESGTGSDTEQGDTD